MSVGCWPFIGWVASATTQLLAEYNAGFIRCCVSTAAKKAAIEQIGFIKTRNVPSHWSPGTTTSLPRTVDAGYLRGDDAMPLQALRGRSGGRRD